MLMNASSIVVQVDPSSPLVARQQGLAPVATHLTTVIQASKNVATNNSNTLVNVGQTNLDTSLQGGVGSSTPKPMSTVTIGATASNANMCFSHLEPYYTTTQSPPLESRPQVAGTAHTPLLNVTPIIITTPVYKKPVVHASMVSGKSNCSAELNLYKETKYILIGDSNLRYYLLCNALA